MMPDLVIEGVTVRFGGLVALHDVRISAPAATITGLIGPNGAGKTTTFNAAAGAVRPASGTVRLGDRTLDRLSPAQRAQQGLGRTFQRMELFDTMTVVENVKLGPELHFAGRRAWCHLAASRREAAEIGGRAAASIERCGLEPVCNVVVGDLSTGQRRLVELARALATPFEFLLLDEPSSGLDASETTEFGAILRDVVARTGVGVLLVEHDMALVRAVCTYCHVLDFGRMVYQGPTADVLVAPIVKSAYLGSEAVESAV
jgi:ABC-type branched-subunit amino acid transport system ATPase component